MKFLQVIPEGNWYCDKCVNFYGYKNDGVVEPKKKKKRQTFKLDEEDNQSTTSSTGGSSSKNRKRLNSDEIADAMDVDDSQNEYGSEEKDDE